MKRSGQLLYYRSRVDSELHPYALCTTEPDGKPMPVIFQVSPGATNLDDSVKWVEKMAEIAEQQGQRCIAIRPTGRGPGTVYQNYGEVDLLEAFEHVQAHYPVDRSRVTVTGGSMGGAAAWYLASHYPGLFAGAAMFCGYCDYRLWEKPGGFTFHMHPWEEPSWRSRSAAYLVENFANTPLLLIHGQWDRSVGGGVSVEHSRTMMRELKARDFACEYIEVPETGHGCITPALDKKSILWLLRQRKQSLPRSVHLVTFGLRHNRNHWIVLDQMTRSDERASIQARIEGKRTHVQVTNVNAFTLDAVPARARCEVVIDGKKTGTIAPNGSASFHRDAQENWRVGVANLSLQKRHGVSGPFGDIFFGGTILVKGTSGSKASSFFNQWVADHAALYFRSRNGGVHRGGIPGQSDVVLPVVADKDLAEDQRRNNNLILYGDFHSNRILKRFATKLPLRIGKGSIEIGGRIFRGDRVALIAIFPHPENSERYVGVHSGVTPDAITWGSHLDMALLPDYLVYDRGKVLGWGFFDNEWKA